MIESIALEIIQLKFLIRDGIPYSQHLCKTYHIVGNHIEANEVLIFIGIQVGEDSFGFLDKRVTIQIRVYLPSQDQRLLFEVSIIHVCPLVLQCTSYL
ncbi:hypothetical protein D3C86_1718350 [compost metagenome]